MQKVRTHLRQHRENVEVDKKQDTKHQLRHWAIPCSEISLTLRIQGGTRRMILGRKFQKDKIERYDHFISFGFGRLKIKAKKGLGQKNSIQFLLSGVKVICKTV